MKDSIRLSIITINFNNLEGLKKTVNSVMNQTYKDFEYIIIDGGSTDGSKEFIEQHQENFDHWVSEPDGGIYDAMNKGIIQAKGEYLNFLNSGDTYFNIHTLSECKLGKRKEDILYGDCNFIYESGNLVSRFHLPISFFDMANGSLSHNATFINSNLFDLIGLYETKYKIVSDWYFFMKAMFRFNCSTLYLNACIINYDTTGISHTQKEKMDKERNEILSNDFSHEMYMYEAYKELNFKYQKIVSRFPFNIYLKIKRRLFR